MGRDDVQYVDLEDAVTGRRVTVPADGGHVRCAPAATSRPRTASAAGRASASRARISTIVACQELLGAADLDRLADAAPDQRHAERGGGGRLARAAEARDLDLEP